MGGCDRCCLQEREGEPRADLSGRAGLHVGPAQHLQPDPPRAEGPGGARLPPVQREGAALAQPRGAAAGNPLLRGGGGGDRPVTVSPWTGSLKGLSSQNLQGYDYRSDIYSLGITACELANGHVPFKDMPATQVRTRRVPPPPSGHGRGPLKPSPLSPGLQMLLEKLNGTVPCLLDTTTIPPEELALKPSRSGADSGICEGPGAGSVRHSNGEPSSSSSGHPYNRTFSPHFHAFVELCLQRDPEKRFPSFVLSRPCVERASVVVKAHLSLSPPLPRPSASTLIGHPFFKQVCV